MSAASNKPATLEERPMLFSAVAQFLKAHSNFESSQPIEAALEDLKSCTRMNDVFTLPLQHKLLSMDSALQYAMFLRAAPATFEAALEEEALETPFTGDAAFSCGFALDTIHSVYDLGVADLTSYVQEAIDEAEDDDEDDDESEEESEEEAPAEEAKSAADGKKKRTASAARKSAK
jgi:hypothetical protein